MIIMIHGNKILKQIILNVSGKLNEICMALIISEACFKLLLTRKQNHFDSFTKKYLFFGYVTEADKFL